jgi:DNA-binding transcriptional MerR regulator
MNEVEDVVAPPETASPGAAPADGAQHEPRYRSGAVARMLRMPVATLRVWERRYQVSQPQLSPSGQRLYSAAQVQRLALLKQLSDLGHAIGSLARLDVAQLQQVADTHNRTLSQTAGVAVAAATMQAAVPVLPAEPAPSARAPEPARTHAAAPGRGRGIGSKAPAPAQAWRVLVVGKLLGQRLKGSVQQSLAPAGRLLHLQGPFETLEEAAAQPLAATADALLVYAPSLQDDWLDRLVALMPAWRGKPMAVLYGFASERTCRLMGRVTGLSLLRGPQSDAALPSGCAAGASRSMCRRRPQARSSRRCRCRPGAGTTRRWLRSPTCPPPSPASAPSTSPTCWCSCRTSRPTAPNASTAAPKTPICTPTCTRPRRWHGRSSRRRWSAWPSTKGC